MNQVEVQQPLSTSYKGVMPFLNNHNLSLEILMFLSQRDLTTLVTRLSRTGYKYGYNSLLWSRISFSKIPESDNMVMDLKTLD